MGELTNLMFMAMLSKKCRIEPIACQGVHGHLACTTIVVDNSMKFTLIQKLFPDVKILE
jgi:hypothetical protein